LGRWLGGARATHTVGVSEHALKSDSNSQPPSAPPFPGATVPGERRFTDALVRYATVRGQLDAAASADAPPAWSAGWELARQSARYAGPGRDRYAYDWRATHDTTLAGRVTVGALWASWRWRPTSRLTLEPGARLELAPGVDGGAFRPAPRLAARFTLDGQTLLSAAVGRSVQYTQALPRVHVDEWTRFYPGTLWVIAGRDVPALTTDHATVGVERWLGRGWLGSVNAYARRGRGVRTTDPTPGEALGRELFVSGLERASGVELSLRRLVGRTTGTLSYSYGVATLDALGRRYASPQDRTHALDATISRRATDRLRLGAAFTAATGAPFTGVMYEVVLPDSAAGVRYSSRYLVGAPSAERRPPVFGADVVAEWRRPFARWELGAYAQLHAPLAPHASTTRTKQLEAAHCPPSAPAGAQCTPLVERRYDTLPVIPTLGLRFTF
jgi:hypothetical protein